jgi:hypothetical protein
MGGRWRQVLPSTAVQGKQDFFQEPGSPSRRLPALFPIIHGNEIQRLTWNRFAYTSGAYAWVAVQTFWSWLESAYHLIGLSTELGETRESCRMMISTLLRERLDRIQGTTLVCTA